VLAVATAGLIWATERAYDAGHTTLGSLAEVIRILSYLVWCRVVWRSSRNVERALWIYVARCLLVLGLVASALLY